MVWRLVIVGNSYHQSETCDLAELELPISTVVQLMVQDNSCLLYLFQ